MNKKPVFPREKNHVSGLNLIEGFGLYGEKVSWPERRKHAVAEGAQPHGTSRAKHL
jgi:hypothetical protein